MSRAVLYSYGRMRALLALPLLACASAVDAPAAPVPRASLALVAEGPCARLSARAVGDTRVVVFGDTGYDLSLWTAGDRLPAAQSMVELTPDGAFVDARLTRDLPVDARGYVPFALEIGRTEATWIRVTTTRYAPHGTGRLFQRSSDHFVDRASRFVAAPASIELPVAARRTIAGGFAGACEGEGQAFQPLAYDATDRGDLYVVGQCEAGGPRTDIAPSLRVGVAARDATFTFVGLPGVERIEGHVDADVHATRDEAWVAVYEAFARPEGRRSYLARGDARGFREVDPGVDEGIMAIDGTSDGTVYLAAGRALIALGADGASERIALPPPTTTRTPPPLHVHDVHVYGRDELWVEASYRIKVAEPERPSPRSVWASALYGPSWGHKYFCDARRDAPGAFVEMEGAP